MAVVGIVRKNPEFVKTANGFIYNVGMDYIKRASTSNNDWIYEKNMYLAWVQFCKYKFLD